MLYVERHQAILNYLESKQTATVSELAGMLYVSEATIRRDLSALAKEGLLRRSHGGAMLLDGKHREAPLLMREGENRGAKEKIAELALSSIEDNSVIMLDSSSTVLRLVALLSRFEAITVITHGLKTALMLQERTSATVHCLGGKLHERTFSLLGPSSCEQVLKMNADIAFMSCRGFSIERGVMDASEDEAQIKRCMIKSARKSVLLLDDSKLEQRYLFRVCEADAFESIIINRAPPDSMAEQLKKAGINLIFPSQTPIAGEHKTSD